MDPFDGDCHCEFLKSLPPFVFSFFLEFKTFGEVACMSHSFCGSSDLRHAHAASCAESQAPFLRELPSATGFEDSLCSQNIFDTFSLDDPPKRSARIGAEP